jgi:hypothetical protein
MVETTDVSGKEYISYVELRFSERDGMPVRTLVSGLVTWPGWDKKGPEGRARPARDQ